MNYEQTISDIRAEIARLEREHGIDEAFAVTYLLLQAQAAMRKARSALDRILLANVEPAGTDWGDSETVRLAKEALKALEGDQPVSTLPDGIWRCSCCGERKPDTTDASWRWNGQGWEHAHGQAGHFEAARSFGGGDE